MTDEYDSLLGDTTILETGNEYDSLLVEKDDSVSSSLKSSMKVATKKNPDQQSNIIDLSEKSGLPADTVERNTAEVENKLRFEENDYDELIKTNPVLSKNLADPAFASIAHDDIENLSFWERTGDISRAVPGGLTEMLGMGLRGLVDIGGAIARDIPEELRKPIFADEIPELNKRRFGDDFGPDKEFVSPVAEALYGAGTFLGETAEQIKPDPERQDLATDIAGGVGQITGQILVSLINPKLGLSMLFAQGADQQARRADEAGATQEEKDLAVQLGATITGITEKIGLDRLMNRLPPKIKDAVARNLLDISIAGGIEAAQEAAEGVLHNLVALNIYDPDAEVFEGIEREALAAGGSGAIFKAIINAITPGRMSGTEHKQQQSQTGVTNKKHLDDIGNNSKDSKLNQRSKEKHRKFIAESLENSGIENVGIPSESLQTFFQENPDSYADFADNIEGFEESFANASALGEDVQIPTDVLAAHIASKEYYDALSQDIRLTTDSMTAREAELFNEESASQLQSDYEKYADQIVSDTEGAISGDKVFDDVKEQLIAAGQTEDIAGKNAAIHKAFFETMAERTGADAFDLYQGQNLRVRGEQEIERADEITGTQFDQAPAYKDASFIYDQVRDTFLNVLPEDAGFDDVKESINNNEFKPEYANLLKALERDDWLGFDFPSQAIDAVLSEEIENFEISQGVKNSLGRLVNEQSRVFFQEDDLSQEQLSQVAATLGIEVEEITDDRQIEQLRAEIARRIDGQPTVKPEDATRTVSGKPPVSGWTEATRITRGGKPAIVYRGSEAELVADDYNQLGASTGEAMAGLGVFLTSSKGNASIYGELVQEFYLDIRNPKVYKVKELPALTESGVFKSIETAKAHSALLIEKGHDGIAIDMRDLDGGHIQFVSFHAEQIIHSVDEAGQEFFQDKDAPRGKKRGRIIFTDDTTIIDLFKDANLSTFLHESGHLFLNAFSSIAGQPNAPQQIQDDMQTILDWLEVDSIEALNPANNGEAAVAAQEKWARGIESYLREGKSPSAALQSAFQRFKSWLLNVYRSAKNLNVELTDEIREVMDRMLATEDEIRNAQERNNIKSVFEADETLSAEQVAEINQVNAEAVETAKEKLLAKLLREITREKKKWWKDEKSVIRKEVEFEYNQRSDFKTKHWLQHGVLPDGTELYIDSVKLSRADLVSMYGDGAYSLWRKLPFGKNSVWTSDGGVHPDVVAGMFGYGSGDQMVKAMIDAGNMKIAINEEAQNRMLERHGDILNDGSIESEADEAMHNISSAKAMLNDINELNKRTNRKPSPAQIYKSIAKEITGNKKIKDISPGRVLQNERRITDRLLKAIEAEDNEAALKLANQRLMNHHLYMAARDAVNRIDTKSKFARSLTKGGRWKNIQKAGDSYIDQIKGILGSFEFSRVTQKELGKREDMRKWVDGVLNESGEGSPIHNHENLTDDQRRLLILEAQDDSRSPLPNTDKVDALLAKYGIRNFRDLTLDEFNGVIDSLEMIYHLAKLKDKLITQADKRRLDEWIADFSDSIIENARSGEGRRLGSTRSKSQAVKQALKEFKDVSRTPSSIVKMLDGYKEGGIGWQLVTRPLNEAAAQEVEQLNEANKSIEKIFDIYSSKELKTLNQVVWNERLSVNLTKHDVLSVLLNWGNSSNRQRIIDGFDITEQDAEYLMEKYLVEKDYQFAKSVWSYLNTFKKASFDLHKDLFGFTPEEVKAESFETPFGTMPGGYYPLKYDAIKSSKAEQNQVSTMNESFNSSIASKKTLGSTKARVARVFRPIETDVTKVIFGHVADVVHQTTHDRALYDIGRLLANDKVKNAITDEHGEHFYKALINNLRIIKDGSEQVQDILDRVILHTRNNATLAMLGGSMRTILLQPFGITNSIVVAKQTGLGVAGLVNGYAAYMANPVKMANEIRLLSLYMKNREQVQSVAISRIKNKIKGGSVVNAVRESTMIPMMKMQFYSVDAPLWWSHYKMFLISADKDTAIEMANQVVRDAQGGGNEVDTAQAMQGGPWRKLFTNFLTYMVTTYNIQVRNNADLVDNWTDKDASKAKALFDYTGNTFMLLTMPAILMAILNNFVAGDDDDEDFAERVAREQASFLLGMNPITAQLSGAASGFDYTGPQGTAIFGKITQLSMQAGQGEIDDAFIKSTIWTIGLATGLPAAQINRTIFGIKDAAEDNESAGKAVKQAVFGPER